MTYDHKWDRLGLRFEALSHHLDRLDREALPHVTRYFESVATLLRRKAREIDAQARQKREVARRLAQLPPWPDTPNGRRAQRIAERDKRDMEIMRLARRGWSNAMIGRRMELSAPQISRIVQKALRATRR
jgi:DNA-binding NarL/FixJ family response regulator